MIRLGSELLETFKELDEAGIPRDEFLARICDSILAAYKETVPAHNLDSVRVIFDEDTDELGIFATKEVVSKVTNDYHEISLAEARGFYSDVVVGEVLEIEVTPADLSGVFEVAAKKF